MNNSLAHWINQQRALLSTPEERGRLLAFAQALTHGTRLTPTPAERQLLDQFVGGDLTLEQLLSSLEEVPS